MGLFRDWRSSELSVIMENDWWVRTLGPLIFYELMVYTHSCVYSITAKSRREADHSRACGRPGLSPERNYPIVMTIEYRAPPPCTSININGINNDNDGEVWSKQMPLSYILHWCLRHHVYQTPVLYRGVRARSASRSWGHSACIRSFRAHLAYVL